MAKRSKSSARWLDEHFTDPFVQSAHAEGMVAGLLQAGRAG
jgi:uncharacterized circularly permuted ATP-grasp superfamily protein